MRKQSHFRFNKQERSGIFFLLLIVVLLQCVYYLVKANPAPLKNNFVLNAVDQSKLDSLKIQQFEASQRIFPFNPNYISDYKAYTLGLSSTEWDRLSAFRKEGNFVNSAEEFQLVTQVSDSLLHQMAPYFKFPEWAGKAKTTSKRVSEQPVAAQVKDLNRATAEELETIYGIGATLSQRIVKFRDRLGGFLVNEQLYDVYGLQSEVVERTLRKYQVQDPPTVVKINVNKATLDELSQLVYINKTLAFNIVAYRDKNGLFASFGDLSQVDGFPTEKLDRIALYLSL